jgi:hypothetical protein
MSDAVREALLPFSNLLRLYDSYESEFGKPLNVGVEISDIRNLISALAPAEKAGDELVLQWRDGAPPKPWCDEWFIAETTFRDRVVLTALPEEYSYDFKTADDTYIKADKIKRWMQFPDSQFIAPATPTPTSVDVEQPPGDPAIAIPAKECLLTDDKDHVFVHASVVRALIQSAAPGGGTKYDGACLSSLPSGESEPLVTTASAPSDPAQEPEAVAWLYAWRQGDSECSRVFQFEHQALEWAAYLQTDKNVHSGEIVPLYTRPVSLDREAVARIIDPEAFEAWDRAEGNWRKDEAKVHCWPAEEKADAILALIEGRA